MSAGRFFVAPAVLADPTQVVLPPEVANQARAVLRLRPGDTVTLLDGTGDAAEVRLTAISREAVVGQIISLGPVRTEPRTQLILYQGLLKAAKFEWIAQKGTELGIAALVPVLCARSVVEAVSAAKLARWRTILTEAAEQSDRGRVPTLQTPMTLTDALTTLPSGATTLLAYEDLARTTTPAPSIAQALQASPATVRIFIGPEGGFTSAEIALAQAQGVQLVTLGPRILRAETAAIVAMTLIMATLGEMG
jgi:16S rRNA (uracil1498-N3)-methyltransferase